MPTLDWTSRSTDVRANAKASFRVLEPVPEHSAGDPNTSNMLIQGDNLDALKSLLPFYAGGVNCIYIDPPFNTGQAFPDYDDNLEHSTWLGMMVPRLSLLRDLLAESGSIFIHLDDNELDYAKVICDELFSRRNFVSRITLKARSPSSFSTVNPGVFKASEYLLWYCKNKNTMFQNRVWVPRNPDSAYNKFIENKSEHFSKWELTPLKPRLEECIGSLRKPMAIEKQIKKFYVEHADQIVRLAEIDNSGAGQDIVQVKRESEQRPEEMFSHQRSKHGEVYILGGKQLLFYSKNIKEIDGERTPARMLTNIWDDISWEGIATEGGVKLKQAKKPERLIRRCIQLTTVAGDTVLDSFSGSGTTVAVAHKMDRHYIGIEMGEQAVTHCAKRLKGVVEGDTTGVSKYENWTGGGGYRFFRVGPPIFDEHGTIHPDVTFGLLASHIWFAETGRALSGGRSTPLLGVHDESAYALLFNGILGDKSVNGGNVLTRATLSGIREQISDQHPEFSGELVVYAEQTRLATGTLRNERITFKQTPYDLRIRA